MILTDTEIIDTIKSCEWRNCKMADNDDIDNPDIICTAYECPCTKCIDDVKCFTLKALFKSKQKEGE